MTRVAEISINPSRAALEEERRRQADHAYVMAVVPAVPPPPAQGFEWGSSQYLADMFRVARRWAQQEQASRDAGLRTMANGWPGMRVR